MLLVGVSSPRPLPSSLWANPEVGISHIVPLSVRVPLPHDLSISEQLSHASGSGVGFPGGHIGQRRLHALLPVRSSQPSETSHYLPPLGCGFGLASKVELAESAGARGSLLSPLCGLSGTRLFLLSFPMKPPITTVCSPG